MIFFRKERRIEGISRKTIKGGRKKRVLKLAALIFTVCLSQTGTRVLAESPRELACSTEIEESDTTLADYVRKYVPQGLELVEGTYRVSDIYCKWSGDTEMTDYEFETAIYTFASEKSEDVYTVVSLVYPYESWKKGTYEHTLYIADSLWPYSPVEGVLYTRNTQEEAWKEVHQIVPPRMGLQMISFSGKQLATTKPYARIIFDFPSRNNPDASREKPFYLLQNTINEVLFIPLWLILCIAAIIIIAAVGTVLLNTGRKGRLGKGERTLKKHGLRRANCFMFGLFAAVAAALVTMTACGGAYRQQMQENFKDNGKGEPYASEIPLNEMDFAVYDKYFLYAPIEHKYERKITLPCDVEYYSTKEDSDPALILSKGTEVYVLPEGSSIIRGYGIQCWPDYEKGWRYGTPFLSFDFASLEDVYREGEIPMYYIKTGQLEKIAVEFYESNQYIVNTIGEAEFVKRAIRHIDQILYDNGVFLSEELLGQ